VSVQDGALIAVVCHWRASCCTTSRTDKIEPVTVQLVTEHTALIAVLKTIFNHFIDRLTYLKNFRREHARPCNSFTMLRAYGALEIVVVLLLLLLLLFFFFIINITALSILLALRSTFEVNKRTCKNSWLLITVTLRKLLVISSFIYFCDRLWVSSKLFEVTNNQSL